MKRFSLAILIVFSVFATYAQDKDVQNLKNESSRQIKKDPNDTIPKIWKTGGLFNLNFNQAALSNWAAGGDKSSLALTSYLNAYAFYKKGKHSWDNTLDLAFGIVSTTSLGKRKSDDKIDFLSKYGYEVAKSWYISGLFNLRTQFANGFSYPDGKPKVLTSDFFAPAYILLSPGINYKPNDHFSVFVSPITARWVIVRNDSLASVGAFGVDSGKHVKFEYGAYASIAYNTKIGANSSFTTRLDLFSNYGHNPQNVDIYWTNLLAVKISKILAMTFTVNMIYDDDVKTVKSDGTQGGAALQLQEVMGIGLAVKF
ncbi:MAG: DUF3078 domain-containing protein [Bacteroidetes bacterium]|nr:DUF3078 domain-containing protein [Bacteroidota bacterium]